MLQHHASTEPEQLVDWRPPAALIGLKKRSFWDAVHRHGIPHVVINPRVIRFRMSAVQQWLDARTVGGAR